MRIPALLYHDLAEPGDPCPSGFADPVAWRYKLAPRAFDVHLAALHATGGRAVSTAEVLAGHSDSRDFLLTFDDGGVSALATADRLESLGWVGHFFITTDYLDRPGFLSSRHLRELADRGHPIGSHSCSHPPQIARLPDAELSREWSDSCRKLADLLGRPVVLASVPGGYYGPRVAEAASAAGVRVLMTSEPESDWKRYPDRDLWLAGRFSVVGATPPATAAALASGDPWACRRQSAVWTLKRWAKRGLGPAYRGISRAVWRGAGSGRG